MGVFGLEFYILDKIHHACFVTDALLCHCCFNISLLRKMAAEKTWLAHEWTMEWILDSKVPENTWLKSEWKVNTHAVIEKSNRKPFPSHKMTLQAKRTFYFSKKDAYWMFATSNSLCFQYFQKSSNIPSSCLCQSLGSFGDLNSLSKYILPETSW